MKLRELLSDVADSQLERIQADGSVPAGHNGLYHDPETPVRNSSHWLVTFALLYDETGDERYADAAQKIISYLRSDDARPHGANLHHRTIEGKDRCNGLIGPAWTIEALTVAARVFEDPELAAFAEELFLMHPQDETSGLWKRVSVEGETLSFDATFNHQIWFAAAGGLLASLPWTSDEVDERVRTHLDEVSSNLRLYPSGMVFHLVMPDALRQYVHLVRADEGGRIGLTFLGGRLPIPGRQQQLAHKAVGYHSFNLYAFALLKKVYPEHEFWDGTQFKQMIGYLTSSEYWESVWDNEYGPAYNPVGFEVPFVMETFGIGSDEDRSRWLTKQLANHYDAEAKQMDKNTEDAETLTARMYQAVRLENSCLSELN
ncbi:MULTISPECIES: agl cluster protein AglQ [Haloferax]|uniref:Agl cluster protein AglQ n=2 Tax=Haloferax TaxID=2251 RepID=A0A6G1Z498_9EURY|nr:MULTISPECIES: agl cluster protein AglQ [Haloferax]KAB1188441.1 agl cluster protein AglQ [Haloferax sp. CBA1149]MRW81134.1 agl cluster protein AglQ [Haloferax marinisediminis]